MPNELSTLRARHARLKRLHDISTALHSTLDSEEALQYAVNEAVRLVNADSGSIALLNPNTSFLDILASTGLPTGASQLKLRVGEGLTGIVARSGKAAVVPDTSADPHSIRLRPGTRSELAVPMEVNGDVRGVLNVGSDKPGAFGPAERELLVELAAHAARAIENAWRCEQLRLKARLFESLSDVSRTIHSELNLDDAFKVITREACELMSARVCSLMLTDPTGEWLDLRASHGAGERYLNKPRLDVEESAVGVVVRRRKAMQIENVQVSGLFHHREVAREEGLFGMLSVPLLFSGRCIGALNVYKPQPYVFSNEEIKILSSLAELSGIAIEKARLYERLVDVEEQMRQHEKLSVLGLLAAEVAHEIRNPLTVMKMLYHSLDLRFPDGDPRAKDAVVIGDKMEQLNEIVERILGFARSTEPKLGPVNLNEVFSELALLVRHKLTNQRVELRQQFEAGLPPITGDATQLEQAFLNLVLNAAEAMPDGGTLTLGTRVEVDSDGTRLAVAEVTDTGRGMSLQEQEKAFTSVLASRKPKGTGLGLAVVKRVVETHRGVLSLTSDAGLGTVVTVKLPLVWEPTE